MKTLAFLGQKGGSGKTTLAVHTAVAAQESGEQVVIIDTDIRIPIDPNPFGEELRQLVIRIQTDEPVRHFHLQWGLRRCQGPAHLRHSARPGDLHPECARKEPTLVRR